METETTQTVPKGFARAEVAFEFLQDVTYTLSGLEGDLTRVGFFGLRLGAGEKVEIQLFGSAQDFLNIDRRFAAPNSEKLKVSGNSTSDFADLTMATKFRMKNEENSWPSIGLRFGVQLPTASNESGLGNDETNFFSELLVEKHFGRLTVNNALGMAILGDPVSPAAQDDLFTYGLGLTYDLTPQFAVIGEICGRAGAGGIGTEEQSRLRFGTRLLTGGVSIDLGVLFGLKETDASTGFVVGLSKDFRMPLL